VYNMQFWADVGVQEPLVVVVTLTTPLGEVEDMMAEIRPGFCVEEEAQP